MKVLIMRASNTMNYGALMMVAIYIAKFKEKYPNASFIVDNVEPMGLERIKFESQLSCIESFKELGVELRPDCTNNSSLVKLWKYSLYAFAFGKKMKGLGIDRVVQLGGDDFSEYYSIKALVIEFMKIRSLISNGLDTVLVGQTIGPFTGWRVKLASNIFKDVSIYTRDEGCFNYLKDKLGLNKVYSSKDLAYLKLPMQDSLIINNMANELVGNENGYITLVPSGLWRSYTQYRECYVDSWVRLIKNLLDSGKDIVLLAHVISDTSDDRDVIESIGKKLGRNDLQKVKIVDQVISAALAREIISRSYCVISGRMHACVSALQTNVPTIPLSYSVKFEGVIGELKIDNYIIECGKSNLWSDFQIVEEINKKLAAISKLDREHYKQQLTDCIEQLGVSSLKQIN